jgi:hypothetical protein
LNLGTLIAIERPMTLQNKTLGEVLFPLTSRYFPRLNKSKNPWELYSQVEGFGRAEAAISKQMEATLEWILRNPQKTRKFLLNEAVKQIDAVLLQYRQQGAQDSEPYYHCERTIVRALDELED